MTPQQQYQTASPSTAELLDTVRDCARNLSDAIKAANTAGLNVSLLAAPDNSPHLVQFIVTTA